MSEITPKRDGFYDHILQILFKLQSAFKLSNIHETLILFHQKLLVCDPGAFYILLTSSFVALFVLIYTYYRLLELSKTSRNILKRKLEHQEISKDRIKNYMLNVLEDSFI